MSHNNLLIVVVGPTAVGKTALTIDLAKAYGGEIISADSRQFYREMEIGTAKPNQQELSMVVHHFINSHSIEQDYDAGAFAEEAIQVLNRLFLSNKVQFAVGGSGLYVKALCDGFDEMPAIDPAIRIGLNQKFEQEGLEPLLDELQGLDNDFYNIVDKKNPQRIIRGLEVIRATGQPFSKFRQGNPTRNHNFEILKIGLNMDRKKLYDRIDSRMNEMIANGLFEEAKRLYPFKDKNALQTVGYKEIFDFLDGNYDEEEAIRLLKRNSRRYAKRQMTWFKKDQSIHWFGPHQIEEIKSIIDQRVSK